VCLSIGHQVLSQWPQFRSAVDQRLAHIIKLSERPRPVRFDHTTPHYMGSYLLSPHHLTHPIRYETCIVVGGWGELSLIPSKLWDEFGIPSWLHDFPTGLPPIKIILVTLEAVQPIVPLMEMDIMCPSVKHTAATVATYTYIPRLDQLLTHSWDDPSLVSIKAAKSDDTVVAFATWNQRIMLAFPPRVDVHPTQVRRPPPTPTKTLDILRCLVQQKQRRLIYLDFRRFMCKEQSMDWAATLISAHHVYCIRAASLAPPAPKRYRGGVRLLFLC
jgi:hypothetical protein